MWFVYGALMRQGSTLSPLAGNYCRAPGLIAELFARYKRKIISHIVDRLYASFVRNLVDFHNDSDLVLHGQLDCISDALQIHAADQQH